MKNFPKSIQIALVFLIFAVSAAVLYQFIYRPKQMDEKLDKCLYGAGVSADIDINAYKNDCYRHFK